MGREGKGRAGRGGAGCETRRAPPNQVVVGLNSLLSVDLVLAGQGSEKESGAREIEKEVLEPPRLW